MANFHIYTSNAFLRIEYDAHNQMYVASYPEDELPSLIIMEQMSMFIVKAVGTQPWTADLELSIFYVGDKPTI